MQNARDIPKKGWKISVFRGTPDFEKVKKKNDWFLSKNGENGKVRTGKMAEKGGVFLKIFRKTPYPKICDF